MRGIIYTIRSLNSNQICIGSMKQTLGIRKSKHIYDSKIINWAKPLHKFINANGGWENYQFSILNEGNFNSIIELRLKERKTINDYKQNKEYILLNTKI